MAARVDIATSDFLNAVFMIDASFGNELKFDRTECHTRPFERK
jgi:hypothetical protein